LARICVIGTAGAGGDLQPLTAAALALRDRGHDVIFAGDNSVGQAVAPFGVDMSLLPAAIDLGPRLIGAIRSAMEATRGDMVVAGRLIRDDMSRWARDAAGAVKHELDRYQPDLAMTSLFGVELLAEVAPPFPWVVINSTFYVGPDPPRSIDRDFAPRAVPLIQHFASLLESPTLTLHATDQVFDFRFDRLPSRHRYVGPLALWEPPAPSPAYLEEPGDPWVLVSISSQLQDDLPLAETAARALADHPLRAVVTLGPDHDPNDISAPSPNVRIERLVPHSAVLKRGVLLVSHAGHGSVMKALWFGRPMVLVPWGGATRPALQHGPTL
jgi:UDP:flavonoid glycosyltransferase YjiC (YdhE family)